MSDNDRRARGEATFKAVYAGDVIAAPPGYDFSDIMLETLFAEIWTRDTLSMRDKRILLLGMIAAQGEADTFKIQTKAGIKNGELSAEDVRDIHIFVAQYCGYPKAAKLLFPMEEGIAEGLADLKKAQDGDGADA